jgi:hypothetical protein
MDFLATMTFDHCGTRVTVEARGPAPITRLRCPVCGLVRWRPDPPELSGDGELISPIQLIPRSDQAH